MWDTDGRFYIHTVLNAPEKLSVFKHYKSVLKILEEQLRDRGFERYYTMADSQMGFRFNEVMGFKTIKEVWDDTFEIMVKELY